MPESAAALEILLILLPGFAAAYIVQLLTVRAKQTDLDKVSGRSQLAGYRDFLF